jgi:Ser/Thr protein kinase RdoA (MazF antagonist)
VILELADPQANSYAYTRLSSESVSLLVGLYYDLTGPITCKFYQRGLHDNYLIESHDSRFICRVYRNDWRSREQVYFELELLAFAAENAAPENAAPVAASLRTKNGELAFSIDGAEGSRMAALFRYADGIAPGNEISEEESALLGIAVAHIHIITETFRSVYQRPVLDIAYLLDESISAVEPFIHAEGLAYLHALQERIHRHMPLLAKVQGLYGICIGDVNPTNFHINAAKQITVFDFDQCGYGYRAFEIGKYISSLPRKNKPELSRAFIGGYQQVRPLSGEEIRAIPLYEMVSVIWVTAIHVYNVEFIGHKMLEEPFWDRRLKILMELATAL